MNNAYEECARDKLDDRTTTCRKVRRQSLTDGIFSEAGFTTDFNYPYAGCLIPNAVMSGQSGTDCRAVMLEINKRTYCDGEGRSIPERLERIEGIVRRILEDVLS